jgi:hypothetical protein
MDRQQGEGAEAMTNAALALALTLMLAGGSALAQGETAAASREREKEKMVMADNAADTWIFTETVSPLDYSPVVIASAQATERPDGAALQLSIQCRRGRTDLVLTSPALAGRLEEQRVTWAIDDGTPMTLAAAPAPTGAGLAIRNDAVRLLNALPAKGELVLHVAGPGGPLQGHFALPALKAVMGRMAGPCKWPAQ